MKKLRKAFTREQNQAQKRNRMHPNKFFKECDLRTDVDFVEVFDTDLKEKLENIHPKNFIKTRVTMPVYKIAVEFYTNNGNYRTAEKYAVFDSSSDDEYADMWLDMFVADYNSENPQHRMNDPKILSVEKICDAVLPIG